MNLTRTEQPLVTCVLATQDRPFFLNLALEFFQHQTYQNKELIIVDDSAAPTVPDIPTDTTIIRAPVGTSLGEKLNIGIDNARGTIIQKLDDDDYYSPPFLEQSIQALLSIRCTSIIVARCCFLVLFPGDNYLRHSGHGWRAGGTLCFYRRYWERRPFQAISIGEDKCFINDQLSLISPLCLPESYILVRHGSNTWKGNESPIGADAIFKQCPIYFKALDQVVGDCVARAYKSLGHNSG